MAAALSLLAPACSGLAPALRGIAGPSLRAVPLPARTGAIDARWPSRQPAARCAVPRAGLLSEARGFTADREELQDTSRAELQEGAGPPARAHAPNHHA